MMAFLRNARDREFVAQALGCIDGTYRPLANPTADQSYRRNAQALYAARGVPWGCEGDAETKARHRCDLLRAAEFGVVNARFHDDHGFVRLPDATEDAMRRFLGGVGGDGLAGAFGLLSRIRVVFREWVPDVELDAGHWPGRSLSLAPALLSRGLVEWRRGGGGFEYRATEESLLFAEPELSDEPMDAESLVTAGLAVEDLDRARAWYIIGLAIKDRDLKQVTKPVYELPATNF